MSDPDPLTKAARGKQRKMFLGPVQMRYSCTARECSRTGTWEALDRKNPELHPRGAVHDFQLLQLVEHWVRERGRDRPALRGLHTRVSANRAASRGNRAQHGCGNCVAVAPVGRETGRSGEVGAKLRKRGKASAPQRPGADTLGRRRTCALSCARRVALL
eukprot:959761-Rhodomonas_salina.1